MHFKNNGDSSSGVYTAYIGKWVNVELPHSLHTGVLREVNYRSGVAHLQPFLAFDYYGKELPHFIRIDDKLKIIPILEGIAISEVEEDIIERRVREYGREFAARWNQREAFLLQVFKEQRKPWYKFWQ